MILRSRVLFPLAALGLALLIVATSGHKQQHHHQQQQRKRLKDVAPNSTTSFNQFSPNQQQGRRMQMLRKRLMQASGGKIIEGLTPFYCGRYEWPAMTRAMHVDGSQTKVEIEQLIATGGPSAQNRAESQSEGRRRPMASKRMTYGYKARLKQFPSFVLIIVQGPQGFLDLCSGTIIGSNLVVAAAHCIPRNKQISEIQVTAGIGWENTLNGRPGFKQSAVIQRTRVKTICYHRLAFEPETGKPSKWDFVALRVDPEFVWTEYVQPACLLMDEPPFAYQDSGLFVVGFGWIDEWFTSQDAHFFPVQHLDNCVDTSWPTTCYKSVRRFGNVCPGDSGGPVYKITANVMSLVAVVQSVPHPPDEPFCSPRIQPKHFFTYDVYKDQEELVGLVNWCRDH